MFSTEFFKVLGLFLLGGSPSGGLRCGAPFKPSKCGGGRSFLAYILAIKKRGGGEDDKKNYIFVRVPHGYA